MRCWFVTVTVKILRLQRLKKFKTQASTGKAKATVLWVAKVVFMLGLLGKSMYCIFARQVENFHL